MKNILLHQKTRATIDRVVERTPHALLLCGKPGSGKTYLAEQLAATILEIEPDKLSSYPYVQIIDPDELTITIENIRSLQQFLKLRVPEKNKRSVNRIIIIVGADRMRTEAQNALLKTVEEPPAGTVLILTSDHPEKLLDTIQSRVQAVQVLPVGSEEAKNYFNSANDSEFARSYALSQGQAGLLFALLETKEHAMLADVDQAKRLLASTIAERLVQVNDLAKDKQAVARLLDALLRISHAGLFSASSKQSGTSVEQWHKKQIQILEAIELLQKNANIKLILDNLFLNI